MGHLQARRQLKLSDTVKDCLNRKGGVESLKVSKGLIKVCQNAHSLYRQELAEKRKQELEVKEAAIRVQEREKK